MDALAGLGTAAFLGAHGHGEAAGAVAGIDLVGLAGVFVYGTSQRRKLEAQEDE